MRNAVRAFEVYRNVKAIKKYVKRETFKVVGFTFGMAFGLGAATGWLISRKY